MTVEGMGLTNVWLGILAIISLLEFLALAVAGFMAFRMYRRGMAVVESIERNQVAPLRARMDAILDEVQVITSRVKHAEDSVSGALKQVAGTGGHLVDVVRSRAWPILGLVRGLRGIASAIFDGDSSSSPEQRNRPASGSADVPAR